MKTFVCEIWIGPDRERKLAHREIVAGKVDGEIHLRKRTKKALKQAGYPEFLIITRETQGELQL